VLHVQRVAGYGLLAGQGNSFGMLILKLKPWDEREGKENDVQAVIGQVYGRTADHQGCQYICYFSGYDSGVWYG
jgi:2A0602: RND transporter, hydrophobe/amphiphile efflux-1 (HAE1) family